MRIFISYSTDDHTELPERLAAALRNEKHRVFLDRDALHPGMDFHATIRKEIRRSHLMVFLISKRSVEATSYARAELSMAQEYWRRLSDRLLPVETEILPDEDLPAALTSVHILRRGGDEVPRVLHEVERIAGKRTLRARALLAAVALVALLPPILFLTFRPNPTAVERWLTGQGIDSRIFCPHLAGVAAIDLYGGLNLRGGSLQDLPAFVKVMRQSDPLVWRFVSALQPEAVGRLVLQFADERRILVAIAFNSAIDNVRMPVMAAGIPIENERKIKGTTVLKLGTPNPNLGIAIAQNDAPPFGRLLLLGSLDMIERVLEQRASWTRPTLPDGLRDLLEFKDAWAVWNGAPEEGEDPEEPRPERVRVGVNGLHLLLETGEKSAFHAIAHLGWTGKGRVGAAQRMMSSFKERARAFLNEPCSVVRMESWGAHVPLPLTDGLAIGEMLLDAFTIAQVGDGVRLELDGARFEGRSSLAHRVAMRERRDAACYHWSDEDLVFAHPGMRGRVARLFSGDATDDEAQQLILDIGNVRNPTEVILPALPTLDLHDKSKLASASALLWSSMKSPRQLMDWLEHGMPSVPQTWSFGADLDEFDPTPAVLAWSSVFITTMRPAVVRGVLERYAASGDQPPPALVTTLRLWLCRPPLDKSGDIRASEPWMSAAEFLGAKSVRDTKVGLMLVDAIATCAVTPDGDGLLRMAEAWPELPEWVHEVVPMAVKVRLREDPSIDWQYQVSGLAPGPAKTALLPTVQSLPRQVRAREAQRELRVRLSP